MNLKDFANSLTAGLAGPIENALLILVHALLGEFENLRDSSDISHQSLLDAVNRLEDRTNSAISGQVASLSARLQSLEDRLESMDPR